MFLQGLGTDDDTLVRVIVSRCEIDMVEIKQEFKTQYNQTLEKFIEVCEELLYIHLKQSSAKDHANEEPTFPLLTPHLALMWDMNV